MTLKDKLNSIFGIESDKEFVYTYHVEDIFEISGKKEDLEKLLDNFYYHYDSDTNILVHFYHNIYIKDSDIIIKITIKEDFNLTQDLKFLDKNYLFIHERWSGGELFVFKKIEIKKDSIDFVFHNYYTKKVKKINESMQYLCRHGFIEEKKTYSYDEKQIRTYLRDEGRIKFFSKTSRIPIENQDEFKLKTYGEDIRFEPNNNPNNDRYYFTYELDSPIRFKDMVQYDIRVTASVSSPEGVRSFPRLDETRDTKIAFGFIEKDIAVRNENKYDFNLILGDFEEKNNSGGSYSYYLNYYLKGTVLFNITRPFTKNVIYANNLIYDPNLKIDYGLIDKLEQKYIQVDNYCYKIFKSTNHTDESNLCIDRFRLPIDKIDVLLEKKSYKGFSLVDIESFTQKEIDKLILKYKNYKYKINEFFKVKSIEYLDKHYGYNSKCPQKFPISDLKHNSWFSIDIKIVLENDIEIKFMVDGKDDFEANKIVNHWHRKDINGFTITKNNKTISLHEIEIQPNI
jgi:hypothetical protein